MGSEMCIRDRDFDFNQDFEIEEGTRSPGWIRYQKRIKWVKKFKFYEVNLKNIILMVTLCPKMMITLLSIQTLTCLLYTSDAADE